MEDKIWYRIYSEEAESTRNEKRRGLSTDSIDVEVKKESGTEAQIKVEDGNFQATEVKSPQVKLEAVQHAQDATPGRLKLECSVVDGEECRILTDYFQLHVCLSELYSHWSQADKHFERVAQDFPGIRLLRQDPTECLFSFICTTNNHISRISAMIERLCQTFGERLCKLDSYTYYSFPTLKALAGDDVEKQLRALGFGYRAKFINQTAKMILETHDSNWLNSLREAPYEEAKRLLRTLPGVGAKVADCVCLMSLDKPEVIPVDTHVWQITKRDYLSYLGAGQKTLTDKVYREIGDYFRSLWGPFAGWAQAVLFSSDLKKFQGYKSKQDLQ